LLSKIIYSSFPFCSFALFKLRFKLMRFAARLKHLFLLLGEMSYSIYILHYPIVFILIFTLKNHLLLAVVLFPLILFPFAYFIERKYQKIVVKLIRFKTN
jgi:peptidoglycan/LPS O-acetylase OafA/YrhL